MSKIKTYRYRLTLEVFEDDIRDKEVYIDCLTIDNSKEMVNELLKDGCNRLLTDFNLKNWE